MNRQPFGYDAWRTWTPDQDAHNEDCNCPDCHHGHIENGKVREYAKLPDYDCCREEIDKLIFNGEWCEVCDTSAYMLKGKCLECEMRKKKEAQ